MNTNFYDNHEKQDKNIIPEVDYRIEDAEQPKNGGKKPKKDFYKTMAKGAAYAAIFGLVAGASFTGFEYISSAFPSQKTTQASKEQETQTLSLTDDSDQKNTIKAVNTAANTDVSEIAEQVMPSIVAID